MCIRPRAAGTIRTAPANRNAYSASGSTRKPTSMHNGANTMQKPATILRKWWASEIPNIEPSLLKLRIEPGQVHLHLRRDRVTGDTPHVHDPVQIFERAVDALNRVDRELLHEVLDPDIYFFPMRSAVEGAFMGWSGMDDFLEDNETKYEYFLAEFERLEPLPDGRLLSIGTIRVKGLDGELETTVRTAGIATFRGGRMLSWHDYGSEEAARANV